MASSKVSYAELLITTGRVEAAREVVEEAIEIGTATLPASHWLMYSARLILARTHSEGGDLDAGGEQLLAVFDGLSTDLPTHALYVAAAQALVQHFERIGEPSRATEFQAIVDRQ